MRLRPPLRADRLSRRLPRLTVYSIVELLLLTVIAVQAARLVWVLVAPVAPIGDYRGAASPSLPSGAILGEFDPFFRLSGAGSPAAVTALDLKLHGVREDRATGRGSAIIALPDGSQRSFAVGEEIIAGVTLTEVGPESVTISRSGTPEQIFLDQSDPAPPVAETGAGAPVVSPAAPVTAVPSPPTPVPGAAPQPQRIDGAAVRLQPRIANGRVDGIAVAPGADAQAFRASGLEPGDVIVAVNGRTIGSVEQARALVRQAGGSATLTVNRGGRAIPLIVRLNL
ncbi:type II secretion system protein N [Sphingosinicella terrae]|jgi:general secretion pathway protein C|uniref:type II secretion system protein N n=1 Tax=Sphingosinicella terrae TaxID=2172047 RepID=UPI0013B463AF|nr:type II secretion system protein N [Sphingosinicella terrae]